MPIAGWGFAAGAGGRQHRRAQAGRADPADRDPARRAGAGGGPAGGRVHRAARQGQRGRAAVRHAPGGPQGLLHRLHRGRQVDHGGLRRPGEAGHPRAGRQERQHRLRRRRPGDGRRGGARRRVRQRRPGLLRPLPAAGAGSVYDRFLALLEPAVKAFRVRGPGAGDRRDGPADLRRARGPRWRPTCDGADVAFAGAAPDGRRLVVPADRAARPLARPTGTGARRSSGRCCRCCRSTTRPTRSGWPTTPSTGCPARSGPATSAGRCGCPRASRPATSASTRTRRCATGPRSAA